MCVLECSKWEVEELEEVKKGWFVGGKMEWLNR